MPPYHVHLVLEALCKVYTKEKLAETRGISRDLTKNLGLTKEAANNLIQGALQLKYLREGKANTKNEGNYLH